MKQWLRILTSRLRFKVLIAALCVVLIACINGWISLRYTNTVTTSVTDTTEIYLPLLTHAISASNAMRSLTSKAHNLLDACEKANGTHRLLLDGSMKKDFAVIEDLAGFLHKVGIREYEVKVRSAKDELRHAFSNLSTICDTQAALQKEFETKRDQASANITSLTTQLTSLRADAEQRLPQAYAALSPPGTTGNPGKRMLTLLKNVDSMTARLSKMDSVLRHANADTLVNNNDRTVQQDEANLAALRAEFNAMATALQDNGHAADRHRISNQLDQLAQTLSGPEGIHDIWNRASLFYSGTIITRMALTRADIALAWALNGMEEEARTRYRQALLNTHATIIHAHWAVTSMTAFVAMTLLLFGWLLARALTHPIEHLTSFVATLRNSKDLSEVMPAPLMGRQDEVGALAQAFSALVIDLAEARKRLLSESRAKIRIQYERLSAAIESIPQGLCLIDADDRLLMSNSRFMALYDLKPNDVRQGTLIRDIMATCQANGAKAITRDGSEITHHEENFSAFERKPMLLNFRNERTILVRTARTPEGGLVSVHEDITERRKQERQISHLAYHDVLTGLANRRLFRDTFGKLLADPTQNREVALLYMDLDLFKTVNDTLGHPVGDQLLIAVAERLQSCLRGTDSVARVGGDEFAVLLTDDPSPEEAARVSSRIIDKIGRPYEINGQAIVVGMSVGIAISPRDGHDPDRLMKCADMALYRAKAEGRNSYQFFEPEMGAKIQARRTLEMELRSAVETEALELAYQPQAGIADGNFEGFEALIRWRHRERGFISPEEFIPVAEETGLIITIGRWVLMQACQEAMRWPEHMQVGVNVSPVQFRANTLVADVEAALSASGLPPHRLELEITEGILLQHTTANLETLESLRQLGVRIAMDDFGTGYSSLGYIRRFRFDRVKIDKSFVHDVVDSIDSRAVVHAVCGLCSTLDIQIVAEGVENEDQLEILWKEGCSLIQGYYIARPMSAADARKEIAVRISAL